MVKYTESLRQYFMTEKARSQLSDEALLKQYRATRNTEHLGVLYQRYLELVYGLCLKYLAQPARAEDAVMHIFEELVSKTLQHEVRAFRPWLYTLARNHCLMQLRRDRRRPEESFEPDRMQWLPVEHPDGEEPRAALAEALRACLEELGPAQRICIQRFYYAEMSYREIAEEQDLPIGKVRSHLQNGRRMLRRCVEARQQATDDPSRS